MSKEKILKGIIDDSKMTCEQVTEYLDRKAAKENKGYDKDWAEWDRLFEGEYKELKEKGNE